MTIISGSYKKKSRYAWLFVWIIYFHLYELYVMKNGQKFDAGFFISLTLVERRCRMFETTTIILVVLLIFGLVTSYTLWGGTPVLFCFSEIGSFQPDFIYADTCMNINIIRDSAALHDINNALITSKPLRWFFLYPVRFYLSLFVLIADVSGAWLTRWCLWLSLPDFRREVMGFVCHSVFGVCKD